MNIITQEEALARAKADKKKQRTYGARAAENKPKLYGKEKPEEKKPGYIRRFIWWSLATAASTAVAWSLSKV